MNRAAAPEPPARRRRRAGLPRARGGAAARPEHAGRAGRHEPLPFPSRVQGRHRRHAQGLRHRAARQPRAPAAARKRQRHGRHVRRGLQFQRALLRSRARHAGHDAHSLSPAWRGRDIRFAVAQCSLGALLVAASAIGICEIALHEDPEHLVRGLQERFSKARLIGADAEFGTLGGRGGGLRRRPVAGPEPAAGCARHRLPAPRVGSAARDSGWRHRHLCAGRRAHRLAGGGARRGARMRHQQHRAGDSCHRVVRTDGSLAGYRWGIERKRELIAREAQAA